MVIIRTRWLRRLLTKTEPSFEVRLSSSEHDKALGG